MWQMQEEDDRREAIRKDIRVEYERQRLLDLEMWAEKSRAVEKWRDRTRYHSDSSIAQEDEEERRRALLFRKKSLSANLQREAVEQERDSISPHSIATTRAVWEFGRFQEGERKQAQLKRSNELIGRRLDQVETASRGRSDLSSLVDFDSEPEDEDSSSLVDVVLQ